MLSDSFLVLEKLPAQRRLPDRFSHSSHVGQQVLVEFRGRSLLFRFGSRVSFIHKHGFGRRQPAGPAGVAGRIGQGIGNAPGNDGANAVARARNEWEMIADSLKPRFRDLRGVCYLKRVNAVLRCATDRRKVPSAFRNGNGGLQGR